MKSIIVDNREPVAIIKNLEELGINVTKQQLTVGDYVISEDLIVERKATSDFWQSLVDQRLFDQIKRLTDTYKQVVFILEGIIVEPEMRTPVYGAISYMMVRYAVQFIPTENHQATSILLDRVCSWVQEDHKDPILARTAPKRLTLEDQQRYLVQGLLGVGEKTAKKLLEVMGTPQNVFEGILSTELLYTRTGKPKGISGPLAGIHGIGFKFIDNNRKLLKSRHLKEKKQQKGA